MQKYLIEFIGAFFLVLTIALSQDPIAIGSVLVVLVYMGGYISGGHYNPAVTLAALINKKIKLQDSILYMLVQIAGGMAAGLTAHYVTSEYFKPTIGTASNITEAYILEILFTFLLCSVALHTAMTDKTRSNNYYGLAIGLTVMAGAFAAGPISGAAFNPAVAIGPILLDQANLNANMNNLLLYILGPCIGSILAALVYKLK